MHHFPPNWSSLRVALAHDWLTGMRGGERVLELLCQGFPKAHIYTLLHKQGSVSDAITQHPIHTSRVQSLPGSHRHYRYLLPLFPSAIERLRPTEADLVISTSHCVAKSIRPPSGAKHLCYCFTPMRYAWLFYEEYFGTNPVKALLAKPILAHLRRWDRRTATRVSRFVAISQHVARRIETFYGREADVVYPPVDTDRCTPGNGMREDFDLVVSALVPYKRVDLAVQAYTNMKRPLKIVGVGSGIDKLRGHAGPSVEFLGWQTDDEILTLYRTCRLLIFPGEEDFGIVPLEAQACGTPVVALRKGGALETVVENNTGCFFDEQTPDALTDAIQRASARSWDPSAIRSHAETFGTQPFLDGLNASMTAL